MKNSIKFLLSLLAASLAAFVFSGCNTMAGVGEDVEEAGEEISESAR
ncbi:MAG: entericidin A/B family lipoprotein [Opitutaceae bacterium]